MTERHVAGRSVAGQQRAPLAFLLAVAACVPSPSGTASAPIAGAADPSIEPVTGISKDTLLAVMGIPDAGNELLFGIFYDAAKIDRAQLAAAPARLCKSRGRSLKSAEDKPLEHPAELPGTRKMIVRCN